MTSAATPDRTAAPPDVPTARQLRARLRRARRRHHHRGLGDLLTDVYLVVLFVAMYGWALVSDLRAYLGSPAGGAADPGERYWIAVAALLAVAGLGWRALRAVGPLLVSAAAQSWAAGAPVDRRGWLLPRFVVLLGAVGGGGALLGVGLAFVARADGGGDLAVAALAGGGWATAALAAAVLAQASRVTARWPRLLGAGLVVGGVLLTVGVVVSHFAGGRLGRPGAWLAGVAVVVGLPLAVVLTVRAVRALPRVDRAALTTGAQFANAAATAAVMLDPTLLAAVVESRRWRGVGRVHSRRFRAGRRWWVLLQAEVRRLGRHPGALAAWAAVILVQYAVAVAVPSVAGSAQVVGAYLAADRLAGGLRSVSRSPGLRRVLGGGDGGNQVAHVVVPAVGAALWWLATLPVGGAQPGWLDAILVSGVVVAVHRAATRRPMDYDTAVADTPFGMIPVGLLSQVLRGLDVVAVLVVAQLVLS
ncbi:DUF6297 family protein [Micromonospora rosaria]|uniref:DUF6297 family protein n=1 Tax=Micromonospora rosaria TaxID=47874 RepID=UPI0037C5ABD9